MDVKWLAARAAAFPPRLQDLVLGLLIAAVNVGTALPYRAQLAAVRPHSALLPFLSHVSSLAIAMVLLVAQAVPLIWRRSAPVAVLLLTGFPRSAYDQLGFGYAPVPLGPAIAYYTVMQRCSTGVRVAVSAVVVAGIVTSQSLPGHSEPYDFFVALLIFVTAGMAGIASRTRRAYLAEVEARADRAEAERDRQAALAAAAERGRIARELHDVVAHHVSLMAVQAEAADALLPEQPSAAAACVRVIGDTGRQALAELRRLLGVLRGPGEQPQAAPVPTLDELETVLAQVRGAGLAVDLSIEGTRGELALGVGLTAYRIVQEGLTNVLRHSAARRASVTLRYEPGFVTVSVTDSGQPPEGGPPAKIRNGCDPELPRVPSPGVGLHGESEAAGGGGFGLAGGGVGPARRHSESEAAPGGFGLAGITERVASCGGTLSFGPVGGGFGVTARLPAL
jgi:signal transduction histidine kinase